MIHEIPARALEQHVVILGKTGSGKTYTAKGAVESLLDASARVCVVDPTGVWWGLKSSATGKSAAYPVAIFGGAHADFPLGQAHGEAVAEIIGTSSTSTVVDTSLMRVGERTRFFADFADALLRKNRGPLHLVIDEAHVFAPQGKVSDPQSGAMLHAANNLVSLGRARGLRIVLISQRPAKLHKDSLTQVEAMVAMRVVAPQDRAAVQDWIKDNADDSKGREIITSLAGLKTGQGWVWAPELGILERAQFPKIRTFDSSRAPDGSESGSGPVLAPINRDAIQARLSAVAADIVANDPATLKRELAAARKELASRATAAPAVVSAAPEQLAAADRAGYLRGLNDAEHSVIDAIRSQLNPLIQSAVEFLRRSVPEAPAVRRIAAPKPVSAPRQRTNGHAAPVSIPKGEAAVLTACIQFDGGLRREQLTVLTGYKRSSRDAYIQRLRERGLVEASGDLIVATQAGVDALPNAEPLPTGEALQDYWLARLPQGERVLLSKLIERYPDAVSRDDLSDATEYKRSSRDAYLQRMAAKQLIDEPQRGMVRASETLF